MVPVVPARPTRGGARRSSLGRCAAGRASSARPDPRDRPGDDGDDVPRRRRPAPGGRPRVPRDPAVVPAAGVGRARSRRDLGERRADGRGRPGGGGRRRGRPRRDRNHEPARDDRRLGAGDGAAGASRDRLAGPAHRGALRGVAGAADPASGRASCPTRTSRPRSSSGSSRAPSCPPRELAFGTIDSWLVWKLTAGSAHVTDVTNASRTMLLDLAAGAWDDELLELFGVDRAVLPDGRALLGRDRRGDAPRRARSDRRDRRRPAGGALRAGVLRPRRGQGNVRHRDVRAGRPRRARRRPRRTAC